MNIDFSSSGVHGLACKKWNYKPLPRFPFKIGYIVDLADVACRRCSNYIFILDLTPGFNGLTMDSCKTRPDTYKFWDLASFASYCRHGFLSKIVSEYPSTCIFFFVFFLFCFVFLFVCLFAHGFDFRPWVQWSRKRFLNDILHVSLCMGLSAASLDSRHKKDIVTPFAQIHPFYIPNRQHIMTRGTWKHV